MTKQDLVKEVAARTGVSQNTANNVLNAILQIITESIKSGKKVTLTGFGTFQRILRAARTFKTPPGKDGKGATKSVKKEARYAPKFAPSEVLKDQIA
jgi:DNA-binding protein HU-beta